VRSVRFLDGDLGGETRWAEIRHEELDEQRGWKKLGLKISEVPHVGWHAVEERRSIGSRGALSAVGDRIRIGAGMFGGAARRLVAPAPDPVSVEVVDLCNARGETIRGILNTTPSPRGGTAVVIPPAWGRTKETLLPLALTIADAFRRAGKPAAVFRFDGTRRRGESYNDPDCLVPGHDHDRFRISEAVENILDVSEFLARCPRVEARRVVLVTFSAASIEGRRAVQLDAGRRICGWVSVVGTPDLQSGMRMVSGGIDYFGGAERGVRFGRQEIMGVATDIDQIAEDALDHRLVFLEDARRDMADIRVPVSWIHGRNDAWLDLGRVREIMGCGERGNRRLVSVPTGHQLRSSLEALDVFRLVAREAGRLSTGRDFPEARPALASIESARRAERERINSADVDLRAFWDSYLLGREGHLGIELMNETSSYRHLMDLQIRMLEMAPGQRVCDAGAGTGPFPLALAERRHPGIELALVDFVPSALKRARERIEGSGLDIHPAYVVADLAGRAEVPLCTESMDRILASLLVSYVPEPQLLLEKLRGLLKPGGRLVVSSLRADADVSKLYVSGIEELKRGRAREVFGALGEREVAAGARRFLNDAARVLDLEEDGHFRFWEERDFCRLVESAGFRVLDVVRGFGDPEQAIVVAAERP
jgi:ubiquinone/menaquinone biosynthesis C-methylase UbiE